jgi:YhgE/Pip-like protein
MFSAEWKYILKENRSSIRILLGILLIPTFYAVIFLSSLWNPYQETSHLPVAVVNEDQPQNTEVAYGKKIVTSLKKSKSLEYHFVDNSQAQHLLKTGKVYMVIQIPKNFSKDVDSLAAGSQKQIPLNYYTSAGHSYVAMKMSTTAIDKLREKLNNQITSQYLKGYSEKSNQLMTELMATSGNSQAQSVLLATASKASLNQRVTSPIKLIHHDQTTVKNNGTGMAPYLMSVALFVGCITLNIIYDTSKPRFEPKNGLSWWASKMSFLYGFIIIAATIMFTLLIKVNGLQLLKPVQTYLFVLLTAMTFLSIVTFFNIIFGMTGAWLMLLFMIVQLGGSAGTYPIQLSNQFFQTIHPYLPMSISIDAFRSSISIGNSIQPELSIFIITFVIFNILMIAFFQEKAHRKVIW